MTISFDSVIHVLQPDDSVVERVMNFDGTYYDVDYPSHESFSEGSIDLFDDNDGLAFLDAVEHHACDAEDLNFVMDNHGNDPENMMM